MSKTGLPDPDEGEAHVVKSYGGDGAEVGGDDFGSASAVWDVSASRRISRERNSAEARLEQLVRARTRAQRLAADQALINKFRRQNFKGFAYDEFEIELVSSAADRLRRSIQNGSAFRDRRYTRPARPSVREQELLWRDEHEAQSIANVAVVLALKPFRDEGLLGGGWNSKFGATVAEYFYGGAILRLPGAYRGWSTNQAHLGNFTEAQQAEILFLESKGFQPVAIAEQLSLPIRLVSRFLRGVSASETAFPRNYNLNELRHTGAAPGSELEAWDDFEVMLSVIDEKDRMIAIMLQRGCQPGEIRRELNLSKNRVAVAKKAIARALRRAGYNYGLVTEVGDEK